METSSASGTLEIYCPLFPGITPKAWILRSDATSASLALASSKKGDGPRKKPARRRKEKRKITKQTRLMNEQTKSNESCCKVAALNARRYH